MLAIFTGFNVLVIHNKYLILFEGEFLEWKIALARSCVIFQSDHRHTERIEPFNVVAWEDP